MDRFGLSLDVSLPDEKMASHIASSIMPDYDDAFEKRSTSSLKSYKNVLKVEINAKDKVALKASFNSYLKLISLCCDIWEGLNGRQAAGNSRI